MLQENISITGYKNFDFQMRKSTDSAPGGPVDTFKRSESLKLLAVGHALDTTINVEIMHSSLNREDENISRIELKHANYGVVMGDFKSDFAALKLLNYQDQIEGTQITVDLDEHKAGFILSNPKGSVKKDILYGTNSQGPYIARFKPMVPNSEKVYLDNNLQAKDIDYEIDYITGKVVFKKRPIIQEEEITIIYESENPLFQDQVMGGKYSYTTNNLNTELYFLKKRSSNEGSTQQQGAFGQNEVIVLHNQYKAGSFDFSGELGFAKYLADTGQTDKAINGKAAAFETTYKSSSFNITADFLKMGDGFHTIDSQNKQPGDWQYGVSGQFVADGHKMTGKHQVQKRTVNKVARNDEETQVGSTFKAGKIPVTISGKNKVLREQQASANLGQQYQRQQVNARTEVPLFSGILKGNIGWERKNDFAKNEDSYNYSLVQSGYTIDFTKQTHMALEGSYKKQKFDSGVDASEKTVKLSTKWNINRNNYLRGFIENRTQTDVVPITIVNLTSRLKPIDMCTLKSRVELESLQETFNNQNLDTEKLDANFHFTLEPVKRIKLKYINKTKSKKLKKNNMYAYDKQDHTYEITSPVWNFGSISLLKKERTQLQTQLNEYPQNILPDNTSSQRTYMAKSRLKLINNLRLQVQYEITDQNGSDLDSTVSNNYSFTNSKQDKFRTELTYQLLSHTLGLTYESFFDKQVLPDDEYSLRNTYTAWDQVSFFGNTMLKLMFNYIKNDENGLWFSSYKPEVNLDVRFMNFATLNLKYSWLNEVRPEANEISENWDLGLKFDIAKHMLVTFSLIQENHRNPDYSNLEIASRISVVF